MTLSLSGAACSSKETVTATKVIDRKPPPTYMVPCPREPFPPPADGSREAKDQWIADVIITGDDCRKTADKLQDWAK